VLTNAVVTVDDDRVRSVASGNVAIPNGMSHRGRFKKREYSLGDESGPSRGRQDHALRLLGYSRNSQHFRLPHHRLCLLADLARHFVRIALLEFRQEKLYGKRT
jgi:hypothetical protein